MSTSEGSCRLTSLQQAAVEILFRARAPLLHRRALLFTRGDRDRANDLVLDTFLAAIARWRHVEQWEHDQQERWLYRVLHNKAVDMWRIADREQPLADSVLDTARAPMTLRTRLCAQ
jgi:DNA-directed RNA polymerase specialized sigma24 family protein